jgi:hypothetical protein
MKACVDFASEIIKRLWSSQAQHTSSLPALNRRLQYDLSDDVPASQPVKLYWRPQIEDGGFVHVIVVNCPLEMTLTSWRLDEGRSRRACCHIGIIRRTQYIVGAHVCAHQRWAMGDRRATLFSWPKVVVRWSLNVRVQMPSVVPPVCSYHHPIIVAFCFGVGPGGRI